MLVKYKNYPEKPAFEMSREDYNSLGPRKKLFSVVSEVEGLTSKQQKISNEIGTGANKTKLVGSTPKPSTGKKFTKNES